MIFAKVSVNQTVLPTDHDEDVFLPNAQNVIKKTLQNIFDYIIYYD